MIRLLGKIGIARSRDIERTGIYAGVRVRFEAHLAEARIPYRWTSASAT
jgi:hypothetical protein